ncbi:MAG: class I SAM-dependent methyltransferase [Ferrovibrio sp.]|uniref:class I SAM-dependent methyltransferase n=1 Tax=Ferrovibrio sp. TaxID=1917215 RepID=UPI00391DD3CB
MQIDHYAADDYFPLDSAPIYEREAHWNIKRIARLEALLPNAHKRHILDFGCGIGGFLRRAAGHFASVTGFDLSSRLVKSHRAAGFACTNTLDELPADIDTIVLFHVLEHVAYPWDTLILLRERFPKADRFVLEVPNTDEALNTAFTSEAYARNHYSADHIWYFTNKTLRAVAERAGLDVLLDTQLQRYTLGNTFGWLAEGRGGGQNKWPRFNDTALNDAYEQALIDQGLADSVFMICNPR